MARKRILIIGGVAGGATCAARIRRLCEECEIIIFEMGPFVSFANCGLPYFIGDVIVEEEKLLQDFIIGIGGMSCASCALFLEMVLQREPDISKATVNYLSEIAHVKGCLSKETLFQIISANGYQAFSIDTLTERKLVFELESKHLITAKKQLMTLGLLSLPVILLSVLRSRSRPLLLLQALFAAPVVLWGGRDIFKKAVNQAKQGAANMDSLIAIGAGAAYSFSLSALFRGSRHVYFDAATGIIDFVLLGRYLEELAKRRVVGDIRKLVNLQPREATLLNNNDEVKISADSIDVRGFGSFSLHYHPARVGRAFKFIR
jgi:P-type Cu+ transporter